MTQTAKEIIRTGRKFAQVLAGARQVFMADGFSGASVDDIAKAAGVSKATLYSYFPDKRLLFIEVANNECNRQADEAVELTNFDRPPQEMLTLAARKMIRILTSPFSQRVFRICVAEADRFPELGQAFYQSGPMLGRARMSEYLQCACNKGEFVIEDMDLAADQFIELCKTDVFARMVFGIQTEFSDAEMDRIADGAVEMFMARYSNKQSCC